MSKSILLPLLDTYQLGRLDTELSSQHISSACKTLLQAFKVDLQVEGKFPKNTPLLVLSNHKSMIDVYAILSLMPETRIKIVAHKFLTYLGKDFSKLIFPVNFSTKPSDDLVLRIYKHLYIFLVNQGRLKRERAMAKNIRSIENAARYVNGGGSVLLFPTGGDFRSGGAWKPGVGYLSQQIYNPNAKVVFVNIKGLRNRSNVRMSKPIVRKLMQRKKAPIQISKAYNLLDLIDREQSGRKVTETLYQKYCELYSVNYD